MPNPCCENSRRELCVRGAGLGQTTSSEPFSAARAFMLWFGRIHGDKARMAQLGKTIDGGRYSRAVREDFAGARSAQGKQDAVAQKLLRELKRRLPGKLALNTAEYAKAMGGSFLPRCASLSPFLPVGAQRLFKKQRQAILFWIGIAIPQL